MVALMLRTGIPIDVWLRQPEGCIETAIRLLNEQDEIDQEDQQDQQDSGRGSGPQLSG